MDVEKPQSASENATGQVSRRTVLKASAALAAGTAAALSLPPTAGAAPGRRRDVAVFGGGMSGLAVAHELIERGFSVTIYEPAYLGGKARSMAVPNTGVGGRRDLPGEHGFRFFPGCYQHVPDTMRRIPVGNSNVLDRHLIDVDGAVLGIDDPGYEPIVAPQSIRGFAAHADVIVTAQNFTNALATSFRGLADIPMTELMYFASREAVLATSCTQRRIGQWENQSWMDFVNADGKSPGYRKFLVHALTRLTVAARAETASARTIGQIGLALVTAGSGLIPQYSGGLINGGVDRILNRPTNQAWIDPWVRLLKARGVRFAMGAGVSSFQVSGKRIVGAQMSNGSTVDADFYVAAMPIDRLKTILTTPVLDAAPSLRGVHHLVDDWMVGIQYYLSRRTDTPPAHIAALGSPWAVTALFQAKPWNVDFAKTYGDGRVRDCLSVDISRWDVPGVLYGKTAKQCTPEQIAREAWAQLKRSLNGANSRIIRDEDLLSWHLDPGVSWSNGKAHNATPLMVNTAGSYRHRPNAYTEIPNLFIGGDHVRTNIDLATMEGANESGRRAANAILAASDSSARKVPVHPLWELPELEPLKQLDADRYRAGLPHILDV